MGKKLFFISFVVLFSSFSFAEEIYDLVEKGDISGIEKLTGKYNNDKTKLKNLINSKDKNGNAPIHIAVINGDIDIVEHLSYKGADLNIGDKNGSTPLHLAIIYGEKEIAELLITKIDTDINKKNKTDSTALHFAAYEGYKTIVDQLLINEANINTKNEIGLTALHYAVLGARSAIAELLIEKGAEVNSTNNAGETPLDLTDALELTNANEHKEVVNVLEKAGAKRAKTLTKTNSSCGKIF